MHTLCTGFCYNDVGKAGGACHSGSCWIALWISTCAFESAYGIHIRASRKEDGSNAEVLEPESLREEIKAEVEKLRKVYSKGGD